MGISRCENKTYHNPIDAVEEMANLDGLAFERATEDEITLDIVSAHHQYELSFCWLKDSDMLHMVCSFDNYAPVINQPQLQKLLNLINSRLIMGHFDYWANLEMIAFRYAMPLSGGIFPTAAQIATLLQTALSNCETYRHPCKLVSISGLSAEESLKYALFETTGSA